LRRSCAPQRVGPDGDATEMDVDGLSEVEKARQDIMLAYLEAHSGNDADVPAVEQQRSFAEELRETYQAKPDGQQTAPEVPVVDVAEAVSGADNLDIPTGDIAGDTAGYYLPSTTMVCGGQNRLTSEIMKQIVADDIAAHRKSLKKNHPF